jgi:hypothetical protein
MASQKLRPFHETIVKAIRKCVTRDEFDIVADLIKATKIPKNHDKISSAWRSTCKQRGLPDMGVSDSLVDQGRAEREAAAVKTRVKADTTA